MIHVYHLAAAFNVDDEKDDNDNENSWIITCNSCSQKRRSKTPDLGWNNPQNIENCSAKRVYHWCEKGFWPV